MDARKYNAWIEANAELKKWKEREMNLRIEICEHFLKGMEIGKHNFTKNKHYIEATKKVNTSVDEDMLSYMWDDLSDEERECFKFKPSLVAKAYKECDDHSNIDQVIVTKPATPTLKITLLDE